MKTYYLIFSLGFILMTCAKKSEKQVLNAKSIIQKSIDVSGGDLISNSEISFKFRDLYYNAKRSRGVFELRRTIKTKDSVIEDVLKNTGFQRFVNDSLVYLSEEDIIKYSNSVNSVHYFSVLPFGLTDAAVHHTYLDSTIINNQFYHIIEITFDEQGGGEDFEDVFLYWINAETLKVDYLAYKYFTDGGGLRFREAFNERYVNGLRFVDYNNYKPETKLVNITELEALFKTGNLEMLSTIKLENIEIELIDN